MVGRGYLKPDLTKVRRDTPKILHLLLERCIKFTREERPEFEQVRFFAYIAFIWCLFDKSDYLHDIVCCWVGNLSNTRLGSLHLFCFYPSSRLYRLFAYCGSWWNRITIAAGSSRGKITLPFFTFHMAELVLFFLQVFCSQFLLFPLKTSHAKPIELSDLLRWVGWALQWLCIQERLFPKKPKIFILIAIPLWREFSRKMTLGKPAYSHCWRQKTPGEVFLQFVVLFFGL